MPSPDASARSRLEAWLIRWAIRRYWGCTKRQAEVYVDSIDSSECLRKQYALWVDNTASIIQAQRDEEAWVRDFVRRTLAR